MWRNCAVSLVVRWLKLVVLLLLLLLVRGGRGCGGRHDCDCDGVVAGGGRLVSGTGTASGTASRSGREQSGAAGEQSIRGAADADAIDAMRKGAVMGSGGQQRGGGSSGSLSGRGRGGRSRSMDGEGWMDARAWGRPSFERGQGFGGGNPPVRGALLSG